MKEPSTLEKEDQSKYLNYPKPPVLDMKWENCDIKVVELENTPKFSKLDEIVTPLRLLGLFFDDILVDMFGYTKLFNIFTPISKDYIWWISLWKSIIHKNK